MSRRGRARQVGPRRGVLNGTEQDYYDEQLLPRLRAGEILRIEFEAFKLCLAHGIPATPTQRAVQPAWYTPDFLCVMADRTLELHEVKGVWREAARVRIKVVAEKFPEFRFVAIQKGPKRGPKPRWITEGF